VSVRDFPLAHDEPHRPLVSAVIPARNAAAYLPATLASVLGQGYRPLEVVVADDGSSDETGRIAEAHAGVTVMRQVSPSGPAASRNRAIAEAHGRYVAFLDADDLWPSEKLAAQVTFLESHPEVGLLFGNARRFSDGGWTEPSLFERYHFNEQYFGHAWRVEQAVRKLLRSNFIPTGTVMARKTSLHEAGLFDERFWRCEDWDLWLRLAARYPIAYSTAVWKLKRVHKDNLSGDTAAMASDALRVLEKLKGGAIGHATDFVPLLAEGYGGLGYLHLRALRLREARDCLRRSLAFGVEPRLVAYFLLTLLGRPPLRALFWVRG
jgi:glycosyltransferase involved in cell wall biosynthesis